MSSLQYAGLILNLWIIVSVVTDKPSAKLIMLLWAGMVLLIAFSKEAAS